MAKLRGFSGGLSGKHGNTVFRQRYGETIAGQYQPIVRNPNTARQSVMRARFKLLSQISSTLKPALAMPQEGRRTPRNLFTHVNFPLTSIQSVEGTNMAAITIPAIQLTKSNHEFQGVIRSAEYNPENHVVAVSLANCQPYSRVGICIVSGASTISSTIHPLRLKAWELVDIGENGRIEAAIEINVHAGELLYALFYGISEDTTGSRETYGNGNTIQNLAILGSTTQANRATLIFTQTYGIAVSMPSQS